MLYNPGLSPAQVQPSPANQQDGAYEMQCCCGGGLTPPCIADLAVRFRLGMETFVSVRPGKIVYDDDRKPVRNTYEADGFTYYAFRLQAPGDEKRAITYPLNEFYEAIGFSGFDYVNQVAYGVGLISTSCTAGPVSPRRN